MKHQLILVICVSLLIVIATSGGSYAFGQDGAAEPDGLPVGSSTAAYARWPVPERPIPHHEPGRPSQAAGYSTTVKQINALGEEESVALTGLDALLADGAMQDPLQGNYRLVNLDKLMFSSYYTWEGVNNLALQPYELDSSTLSKIPGSWTAIGDHRYYDIDAADLNGDLVDEQLTAFIGPAPDHKLRLSISDLPGRRGRVTSSPAVFTDGGQIHQFVRGYDSALWYHNGSNWSMTPGTMLSGPAVAAQGANKFDVFFVTFDPEDVDWPPDLALVRFKWAGGWQGLEYLDPPAEGWPVLEQVVPLPELAAPAATASGDQLDLFWLAPDNTLRWVHNDGAAWGEWQNLGGLLASAPGAVAHDGQIDVLARGVDDALWHINPNGGGEEWRRVDRPGMPEGVSIASAPSVVSPAANELLVTVLGSDDQMWQLAYNSSVWGQWQGTGVNKSVPGKVGRALALDGDAEYMGVFDYVELPPKFPNAADFTFAAWVYWEGGDPWQRIFDFGQGTTHNMFLTPKSAAETLRFAITESGSSDEERLETASALQADSWHHVAVTLKGDVGKLFVDGAKVDQGEIKLNPEDVLGNNNWLGRSQYNADRGFKGKIDEVAIFDQALSDEEIASIYSAGWEAEDSPILGLHMDENPATHGLVLKDMSPFGNDGTLRNFIVGSFTGAPAVVVQGGQIDILGQMDDGYLGRRQFDGSTWLEWMDFNGLPVGQRLTPLEETAFINQVQDDLENLSLDMAAGYFSGDGREQIALAYQSTAGQIGIVIYDTFGGFIPYKIAALPASIQGTVPRITAADVDGDGTDEIGIAHLGYDAYHLKVEIFDVEIVDGRWTGRLIKMPNDSPQFYFHSDGEPHMFSGTLKITSGDFVKDPPDMLNEEIAVVSDWTHLRYMDSWPFYGLFVHLYILDNDYTSDKTDCWADRDRDSGCPTADYWLMETTDDVFKLNRYLTGVALGAGDVNGDGYDEIVLSWPYWFDGHDWPDLVRTLRVLNAREIEPIAEKLVDRRPEILTEVFWLTVPGEPFWQNRSYLDTLAVGDLDRDMQDEIVFYHLDELVLYDYNGLVLDKIVTVPAMSGIGPKVSLVMGDFTGEALRVGRPTYRLESQVGGLIALINEPPKHIGVNGDDSDTYASYENEQGQSTEMSLEVTRDWGMATGQEVTAGDPEGTHVTASIDTTYDEYFGKGKTVGKSISFGSSLAANKDDMVVFSQTNYKVWEYPLYDDSNKPSGYISVVFPQIVGNNQGTLEATTPGSTCDFWYAPNHEINNVWSYPVEQAQFTDFDNDTKLLAQPKELTLGGGTHHFWTSWENYEDEELTNSVSLGVSAGVETQVGGDEIPIIGYKIPFSVKATVSGHYNESNMSTHTVSASQQTSIHVNLNNIDSQYSYAVTPYLYWSKNGYLVLDYLTRPGEGTAFWSRYTKGDPAFIRPWDTEDEPCGENRVDFSKEVIITPAFVNNAEEITISAMVRNFSPVDINNVKVRFYQGDPQEGGRQLGSTQTIARLLKRGREKVSITTTIEGSGEQRIYAVIDAGGPDKEMDTSNNKAYGLLMMGESKYVDPGHVGRQPYAPLALKGAAAIAVHVPPGKLSQTTRFEVREAAHNYSNILGRPFELLAYQGSLGGQGFSRNWDNPVDGLDLTPDDGDPPAAIIIDFAGFDLAGLEADELTLWYDMGLRWIVANETCGLDDQNEPLYPILNFPDLLVVPVCSTGEFAIAVGPPEPPEPTGKEVYMAVVMKH